MRVAILDSGIHAGHPHVGAVAGGFDATGLSGNWLDSIGHGTAVAGAIRSHAPDAELLAVKIFHGGLRTNIDIVLRGIRYAMQAGADILNLSLGASNPEHAARFADLLNRECRWVSAAGSYPGLVPGVLAIEADPNLPRDQVTCLSPGRYAASPYPREIPGVPRERNLHGASFAVANFTGLLAAGRISVSLP
jgi:subtilisin family serine protease